jgi:hypothetical protein
MLKLAVFGAMIGFGLALFVLGIVSPASTAQGSANAVQCRVRAEAGHTTERTCPAAERRGCTAPITVKLEAGPGTGELEPSATVFCGGSAQNGGSEATCGLGLGITTCEVTNNLFTNVYTTDNGCRVTAALTGPAVAVCTFTTP